MILLALTLLGCARDAVPTSAPSADLGCPAAGATMTLPEFPPGAALQFMTTDREGAWRGFRVMQDGRLLRTSREGAWEEDTPLDAARLAAVQGAVTAASLAERAAIYGAEPHPDDATSWALQALEGGGSVALGGVGCRPAFVDALIEQVAPQLSPPG